MQTQGRISDHICYTISYMLKHDIALTYVRLKVKELLSQVDIDVFVTCPGTHIFQCDLKDVSCQILFQFRVKSPVFLAE